MICIKDDIVQKYIDGEASPDELAFIENHLASCNKCEIKIQNQIRLAASVKKAVKLLSEDTIEVPDFKIPSRNIKKHILAPKRLYYFIAAACILFFVIVITQKKESKNNDDIKIDISSIVEVDANRTVSQLPVVISIFDSEGKISGFIID